MYQKWNGIHFTGDNYKCSCRKIISNLVTSAHVERSYQIYWMNFKMAKSTTQTSGELHVDSRKVWVLPRKS